MALLLPSWQCHGARTATHHAPAFMGYGGLPWAYVGLAIWAFMALSYTGIGALMAPIAMAFLAFPRNISRQQCHGGSVLHRDDTAAVLAVLSSGTPTWHCQVTAVHVMGLHFWENLKVPTST